MVRDYHVAGEVMVSVYGGHPYLSSLTQFGLASDSIDIVPVFYSQDIHTDDFGPRCPVDVMRLLGAVIIHMTLVHYDEDILDCLTTAAMGRVIPVHVDGTSLTTDPATNPIEGAGICGPAGILMGRGLARGAQGNLFTSLNLIPADTDSQDPWRFYSCHLMDAPHKIPFGVKRTLLELSFRAIPYQTAIAATPFDPTPAGLNEWQSDGAIIYDHENDT